MKLWEWPLPLVHQICGNLDPAAVLHVSSLCRSMLKLREDAVLWQTLYNRDFGPVVWRQVRSQKDAALDWSFEYFWERCYANISPPPSIGEVLDVLKAQGVVAPDIRRPQLLLHLAEKGLPLRLLPAAVLGELLSDVAAVPPETGTRLLNCGLQLQGKSIVEALQTATRYLRLPGEAQKIDRVLEYLARAYCDSNPSCTLPSDSIYIIFFGLIMLQTDRRHHYGKSTALTEDQFVAQLRGIEGVTPELSRELYADSLGGVMPDATRVLCADVSAPTFLVPLTWLATRFFNKWQDHYLEISLSTILLRRGETRTASAPVEGCTVRLEPKSDKFLFHVQPAASDSAAFVFAVDTHVKAWRILLALRRLTTLRLYHLLDKPTD
eukprot:TRINITY_DN17068_c0_g1_i1.p1 TRINITY_DN17068_c0_g1~~TRINITY_DN17068_c0_g1_i1.p1  ORF type:complete len:393 (+),score=48.97 TRINITY_DN17068_c0_g1_i1:42-1181(+)